MEVKVDGKQYRVNFAHLKYDDGERVTVCSFGLPVAKGELPKVLATGVARCSKHDNFNKATGRKLSLTRALNGVEFTKSQRTQVWNQYFGKQE